MPMEDRDSALEIQAGVQPPPAVNPRYSRLARTELDAASLYERLRNGDRGALARAITLIESTLSADEPAANLLCDLAASGRPETLRVGWTGVPGVGKSTLINRVGGDLAERGHRIAVLTVDPSSATTRGSILGDKSRMPELAIHPNAFIRPSPSGGSLGGIARKTREAISLCEAAGYDTLFIETVGVGQSETAVHGMCDVFVLLMLPGAGDELQGIKRGILELADIIAVTKADGATVAPAELAAHQIRQALSLYTSGPTGWSVPTITCSAVANQGIEPLWNSILDCAKHLRESGWFARRRADQDVEWMEHRVVEAVVQRTLHRPRVAELRAQLEPEVRAGKLSPRHAAAKIIAEANDAD